MKKFQTISVTDAVKLIEEAQPMLLDCRKMQDYRQGHIENALHAHDGLTESLIKRGDKQRSLLIYCYTGHSSEHLAELFGSFGFRHVYSLEGGYASWLDAHAPQTPVS